MRTMEEIIADYIMDEAKLPPYTLPDPLECADGSRVQSAFDWMTRRRTEVLRLFMEGEYGFVPPRPDRMTFEVLSVRSDALDGTAVRKEIRLHFARNDGGEHAADLLLYLPKNAPGPVPVFLGLNFTGNHAASDEPDVRMFQPRMPGQTVEPRGSQAHRWCFREVIARGYASATACYHDFYPDFRGAVGQSIYGMLFDPSEWPALPNRYTPIGAWAWGLSRMLDYLESDPQIDAARAAVHGHSRLGKTSLWTGAVDPRFQLVISNDSGCAGGALHKRKFGENVEALISHSCADWFVTAFHQYSGHEENMPFDQHELLALIAPRPLAVGTATEDVHADPKGELLSCFHASKVYELFGADPFTARELPPPDGVCSSNAIHFHYRKGGHEQLAADWAYYLDLADRFLRQKTDSTLP